MSEKVRKAPFFIPLEATYLSAHPLKKPASMPSHWLSNSTLTRIILAVHLVYSIKLSRVRSEVRSLGL